MDLDQQRHNPIELPSALVESLRAPVFFGRSDNDEKHHKVVTVPQSMVPCVPQLCASHVGPPKTIAVSAAFLHYNKAQTALCREHCTILVGRISHTLASLRSYTTLEKIGSFAEGASPLMDVSSFFGNMLGLRMYKNPVGDGSCMFGAFHHALALSQGMPEDTENLVATPQDIQSLKRWTRRSFTDSCQQAHVDEHASLRATFVVDRCDTVIRISDIWTKDEFDDGDGDEADEDGGNMERHPSEYLLAFKSSVRHLYTGRPSSDFPVMSREEWMMLMQNTCPMTGNFVQWRDEILPFTNMVVDVASTKQLFAFWLSSNSPSMLITNDNISGRDMQNAIPLPSQGLNGFLMPAGFLHHSVMGGQADLVLLAAAKRVAIIVIDCEIRLLTTDVVSAFSHGTSGAGSPLYVHPMSLLGAMRSTNVILPPPLPRHPRASGFEQPIMIPTVILERRGEHFVSMTTTDILHDTTRLACFLALKAAYDASLAIRVRLDEVCHVIPGLMSAKEAITLAMLLDDYRMTLEEVEIKLAEWQSLTSP